MPEDPRELRTSAERMAGEVNMHVSTMLEVSRDKPGFVAIHLSDGSSPDHELYDSRADAVRHHIHDRYMFFVKVGKDSMPVTEAEMVLRFARQAFRKGVVFTEEDATPLQMNELNSAFLRGQN